MSQYKIRRNVQENPGKQKKQKMEKEKQTTNKNSDSRFNYVKHRLSKYTIYKQIIVYTKAQPNNVMQTRN